jgi:hypothetical protein
LPIYLEKKIETGVKINFKRKKEILNFQEDINTWNRRLSRFEPEIIKNNEIIRSLSNELKEEKKFYKTYEDHARKVNINKIERKILKLHEKNQELQEKIIRYDTKIKNGKITLEKLYTIFKLEYFIKLHQKLWNIRMKCLNSGMPNATTINKINKEINTNPMFEDINNNLLILDQEGINDFFRLSKMKIILGKND